MKYEAVHHIRDWRDLRRRLEADRRCFALFHASLPDEPLVFTELALTSGLSARVQPLLDPDSPVLGPSSSDCAIFYSISSCHEGLRGVPFGNALIRRAIDALTEEFPRLTTFATLSPVPGFRAWLNSIGRDGARARTDLGQLVAELDSSNWFVDTARSAEIARSWFRSVLSICCGRSADWNLPIPWRDSTWQRRATRTSQLVGRLLRGRHPAFSGVHRQLSVPALTRGAESSGVCYESPGDCAPAARVACAASRGAGDRGDSGIVHTRQPACSDNPG